MNPPLAVANYFIGRAMQEGKALTPMQVIKLTYLAHAWHLAISSTPLIAATVEAWKFGPVIPSLYRSLKKYGSGTITEEAPTVIDGQVRIPRIPRIEGEPSFVNDVLDF